MGMLALSRLIGETITITLPDGQRIKVMLIACRTGKAKIGIDAPRDCQIWRGELQSKIDAEAEQ
jgi:carbon storage regulator CsrA